MRVWWDEDVNLPKHWKKRQSEDPMCWKNLIENHSSGVLMSGSPVDQNSYRDWSFWTADNCWYKYEAQQERAAGGLYPTSTYYIDDRLVKVVARKSNQEVTTCYHVSFHWIDTDSLLDLPLGERQSLFVEKLNNEKEAKTRRFREIRV